MSHPVGGLRVWKQEVKVQFFSEQCHVAYQIKGNHEFRSMVANILLQDTYPTPYPSAPDPGVGVKSLKFIFKNMVMLQIKLKKITKAATW